MARLVADYACEPAPDYGNLWIATPPYPGRIFFFTLEDEMEEDFELEDHFGAVSAIVGCPFHECRWGAFNGIVRPAQPFPAAE